MWGAYCGKGFFFGLYGKRREIGKPEERERAWKLGRKCWLQENQVEIHLLRARSPSFIPALGPSKSTSPLSHRRERQGEFLSSATSRSELLTCLHVLSASPVGKPGSSALRQSHLPTAAPSLACQTRGYERDAAILLLAGRARRGDMNRSWWVPKDGHGWDEAQACSPKRSRHVARQAWYQDNQESASPNRILGASG
jgi:hypothetical protein